MAVNDEGFETKRFNTILEEMNEETSINAGVSIDTSSNSLVNILNSVVSRQLSLLYELGEGLNDSTDILKAEGQALDNLALQVGLLRTPAQKSIGIAWFTGNNGTSIPTSALIATARGDNFQPLSTVTITSSQCLSTNLTVNTVLEEVQYQITVDGTQYNYTSLIGDDKEDIIEGLRLQLVNGSSLFTVTNLTTTSLRIVKNDLTTGNTLSVTANTYVSFSSITSIGTVASTNFGFIEGSAHTLQFIKSPINGWNSVDNPSDIKLGRFVQSDDELRSAILNNYEVKESSTTQGIKSALEDVTGVTHVSIFENIEFYTVTYNDSPVKGKSYVCTVDGGLIEDIGQVIYNTKPVTGRTSGVISVVVEDDEGQEHTVYFSRSLPQYFYMKIAVTKYSEEDYPADGDNIIKQSCLLYGDELGLGEDVIPQRFVGAIYEDVEGIENLVVQVAYSTNPSLAIDDGSLVYTTAKVPMLTTETPLFATSRMEVTIV